MTLQRDWTLGAEKLTVNGCSSVSSRSPATVMHGTVANSESKDRQAGRRLAGGRARVGATWPRHCEYSVDSVRHRSLAPTAFALPPEFSQSQTLCV